MSEATFKYDGRVIVSENMYKCSNELKYTNVLDSCLGLTWPSEDDRCAVHLVMFGPKGDAVFDGAGNLTKYGEQKVAEVLKILKVQSNVRSFGGSQNEWGTFIKALETQERKIVPVQNDKNKACWSCTHARWVCGLGLGMVGWSWYLATIIPRRVTRYQAQLGSVCTRSFA